MSRKIFITGTGTDVGKTYISALILKKLNEGGKKAAYYKAAMSGNIRDKDGGLIPGDALYVKETSDISQPVSTMCPYVYEHAVSPHLAARIEGNPVEMEVVISGYNDLCRDYDYITLEGSGGILCPIRYDQTEIQLEDVIKQLDLSCIIVADAGLGTINAVGLTAAYLKSKHIPVKGIIFNHFHPGNVMEEDNLKMCKSMTGLNVLACVKDGDNDLDIDVDVLTSLYD